jgi:prepilin-type N-terminal cleavage/methylation domain-containing protein
MIIKNSRAIKKSPQGFTLIEILIVIGMIAILAAVVLVAINPLRQFAQARNSQRVSNVNTILNAVGNRIAENKGKFNDDLGCSTPIPTTATVIKLTGGYDLRSCLIPSFVSEIPIDPSTGSNTCVSTNCLGSLAERYDTGYTISKDPTGERITICAPSAMEDAIPGSSPYCLTR